MRDRGGVRCDVDIELLKLAGSDFHPDRNHLIYRQTGARRVFSAGFRAGRLKLAKRMLAVGADVAPDPFHPHLITGRDYVFANLFQLLGCERR